MPPQQSENGHPGTAIDIRQARRLFANPDRVAESDFLRREVSGRMRERLQLIKVAPGKILDAGCGEGADVLMLQTDFTQAFVLGLDASFGMLGRARQKRTANAGQLRKFLPAWVPLPTAGLPMPALVSGDFASLPLAPNTVDLLWSNLALHWHPQPDRVIAEWRRVIKTDGLLMFSALGPDTFKELRDAFAVHDKFPHVLPFVDMHDFGDMLVHAGFSTPVMDMETITITYPTVERMLSDIRAMGGLPLGSRRKSLTGRQRWKRMIAALDERRRPDGLLALTIEVVYGHAFLPVPKKTASGESIIRFERR